MQNNFVFVQGAAGTELVVYVFNEHIVGRVLFEEEGVLEKFVIYPHCFPGAKTVFCCCLANFLTNVLVVAEEFE